MKGVIKTNTVDKYLNPIRHQLSDLIASNSNVVEFGCGNGDLLFILSHKIQWGTGIDNSASLIKYASNRKEKEKVENLTFKPIDLTKDKLPETKMDYAVASLLFHVLPKEDAINLLRKMIASSEVTLVCGFSEPKSTKQRLLLWLDQRFTKHFFNFKSYQKEGFMNGLLHSIHNIEYCEIDTFDPVIKIYKISKCNNLHSKQELQ